VLLAAAILTSARINLSITDGAWRKRWHNLGRDRRKRPTVRSGRSRILGGGNGCRIDSWLLEALHRISHGDGMLAAFVRGFQDVGGFHLGCIRIGSRLDLLRQDILPQRRHDRRW